MIRGSRQHGASARHLPSYEGISCDRVLFASVKFLLLLGLASFSGGRVLNLVVFSVQVEAISVLLAALRSHVQVML